MKEVAIDKLPIDYINYISKNIGVHQYIGGQLLWYCKNACHVNSLLFCNLINTITKLHCSIIEGIVICNDGLAYEHQWNLIRDDNNNTEYVDVTMDAIASENERNAEKKYFEIFEHNMDEMLGKIAEGKPLFSKEVHNAIDEYYKIHPEKESFYREGKRAVDSRQ